MERPAIPEIERAADDYVKVRDKRMKLTEQEITAKASLIASMQKHQDKLSVNGDGQRIYRFDDEIVILDPGKVNVKVKTAHADDADEGED